MKRNACILILWILTSGGLIRCTSTSPLEAALDLAVIRAYLYAGQPVNDIQITGTVSLGAEELNPPPINDAAVSLTKDGVRYDLTLSPGDSGYYHYAGADLTVETGDIFDIKVESVGQTATGRTQVPQPPVDVEASGETLFIPHLETWEDMRNFTVDSTRHIITITWNDEPQSLFFVVIENTDIDPDTIDSFMPMGGPIGGPMMGRGRFITGPSNVNWYRIDFRRVSFYGAYRVRVYRVNQEYADLYSTRQQDSRDLNEPLTNIQNGLGIFSAFNCVEVTFQVVQE